jgi:hypothetical protein
MRTSWASSKQFRNEEFGEESDGGVAAGLPEYRAARIRPQQ